VPAETHVEKGPLDRQQVLELIRDLLADIFEIEPSAISESSSFAEDLDADSLALIELVEGLEEELGRALGGLPDRRRGSGGAADRAGLGRLRVHAKLGGA
jgi:acyl carrier protein